MTAEIELAAFTSQLAEIDRQRSALLLQIFSRKSRINNHAAIGSSLVSRAADHDQNTKILEKKLAKLQPELEEAQKKATEIAATQAAREIEEAKELATQAEADRIAARNRLCHTLSRLS